jgi:hypothetical protein
MVLFLMVLFLMVLFLMLLYSLSPRERVRERGSNKSKCLFYIPSSCPSPGVPD